MRSITQGRICPRRLTIRRETLIVPEVRLGQTDAGGLGRDLKPYTYTGKLQEQRTYRRLRNDFVVMVESPSPGNDAPRGWAGYANLYGSAPLFHGADYCIGMGAKQDGVMV